MLNPKQDERERRMSLLTQLGEAKDGNICQNVEYLLFKMHKKLHAQLP